MCADEMQLDTVFTTETLVITMRNSDATFRNLQSKWSPSAKSYFARARTAAMKCKTSSKVPANGDTPIAHRWDLSPTKVYFVGIFWRAAAEKTPPNVRHRLSYASLTALDLQSIQNIL